MSTTSSVFVYSDDRGSSIFRNICPLPSDYIASCFKDSSLHTGCCEKIKYIFIHPCFHESLINRSVHDKLTESWLVGSEIITGSPAPEDSLFS